MSKIFFMEWKELRKNESVRFSNPSWSHWQDFIYVYYLIPQFLSFLMGIILIPSVANCCEVEYKCVACSSEYPESAITHGNSRKISSLPYSIRHRQAPWKATISTSFSHIRQAKEELQPFEKQYWQYCNGDNTTPFSKSYRGTSTVRIKVHL